MDSDATMHSGTIHGRMIELSDDPHLQEGEKVEVFIRRAKKRLPAGEGLRQSAGILANDSLAQNDLDAIYNERRATKPREIAD